MDTIVLKFGGASVARPEQFSEIAKIVAHRKSCSRTIVVVSAMGDTTDQLLSLARQVHPQPPLREQDMLLTVGERVSISLLAMALELQGVRAISFTGSQSGIITSPEHSDARILEVRPHRIIRALNEGNVVIVAGFQGVSRDGEITTLGRGGSDTTAVALAVALGASKVEFYKDVEGMYAKDPKIYPDAQFHSFFSFDEALEIVERGAKVLHSRCLGLAKKNGLPLHVLSFNDPYCQKGRGTLIGFGAAGGNTSLTFEG